MQHPDKESDPSNIKSACGVYNSMQHSDKENNPSKNKSAQ
jgi:hypothetical protein